MTNKKDENTDELIPCNTIDYSYFFNVFELNKINKNINQIFRPGPDIDDIYYKDNIESIDFVNKYCKNAKMFEIDADILRYASDSVIIKNGIYIEAGVCRGVTINFIAALNPKKTIYGFDSFEGLPTKWITGINNYEKGHFSLKMEYKERNQVPVIVLPNVKLFKGLFRETMSKFKNQILKSEIISFIHIDCDLYESTKDIFNNFKNNITSGTILAFDELYNYPNYKDHEYKAFMEFINETNLKFEVIAFNSKHRQVIIKIL